KYGGLNHSCYGNPPFGLRMSYPGSPDSLVGPGSLLRHNERNMRFSFWNEELILRCHGIMAPEYDLDKSFASFILEEFKTNKTKCFELPEVEGHDVELSSDQYESLAIWQKLETATTKAEYMVIQEIMP
ncbi:hypothetical protein IFM89_010933, partial [Coptis chinensis]